MNKVIQRSLVLGGAVGLPVAYYYSTIIKPAPKQLIPALDGQFKSFKLKEIKQLNHNTSQFRFSLNPGETLGLPTASCVVVKAVLKEGEKPGYLAF